MEYFLTPFVVLCFDFCNEFHYFPFPRLLNKKEYLSIYFEQHEKQQQKKIWRKNFQAKPYNSKANKLEFLDLPFFMELSKLSQNHLNPWKIA